VFRRLFWLVMGAAFGFGVAFWLMRAVRETAAKYTPAGMSDTLAGAVRQLGTDLREAVAEGREAMQETEERIRSEVAGPRR
jgi:gas vesicle protein